MAPPWEAPKPRRKLLGLTQNALVTAVISVVLSGIVAYLVAHYQSQDAARQATVSEQVQEVSQLESDVKSYFQLVKQAYGLRNHCAGRPSLGDCKGLMTPVYESPFIGSELTIGADLANVSDAEVTRETYSLEYYTQAALSQMGTQQGYTAWTHMGDTYASVITRCGQLIQGQN